MYKRICIYISLDCGNLTDPDNGSVSQTGSKVFDVASYSCNPGYKLVPEVGCSRICLDSGNWSGFKPECIRGNFTYLD